MWKNVPLTGWGRVMRSEVPAARPESLSQLRAALADAQARGDTVLAHGGGRSYGDEAIAPAGRAILTARLDRLLDFNPESGLLTAEGGVTFDTLMRVFLPRGWLVPVSPGTAFATLAGAVANDVHGKNHDRLGSFGDHLLWLELMTADGSVKRVSPLQDRALFEATIGGIGLTGIITAVSFHLIPVPSNAVVRQRRRIDHLDAYLEALNDARAQQVSYSVGWIDGLARGKKLGRGILETAEPSEQAVKLEDKRPFSVPFDFPGFALNRVSVGLFNHFYRRRVPKSGRTDCLGYPDFLYPLDRLRGWNRIYGKRGFYQFQCVIPDQAAQDGLRAILTAIAKSGSASFLSVLKSLGSEGRGMISFPIRGMTLALDFPRSARSRKLVERLNAMALDHGGRVYPAKDSLLTAEQFEQMYPRLGEFRSVLSDVDPNAVFSSAMAERLRVRGGA